MQAGATVHRPPPQKPRGDGLAPFVAMLRPSDSRALPSVPASMQGNGLRRVIRDAEPEPPPQKSRGDGSRARRGRE